MEKTTIMLVEDNPDDELLARVALSRSGVPHELLVFSDGEAAVEFIYSDPAKRTPPALILLDLQLPRLNGKDLLRQIRGNPLTARVPVITLTSSRLEQDLVDAYTLGANSYFVKPTSLEEFSTGTLALAHFWLGLNLAPPAFKRSVECRAALAKSASVFQHFPQARLTTDVIIVDANAKDRELTSRAIQSLPIRTRHLHDFDAVIDFMRNAGGPPPLLDPKFPRLFLIDVDLDEGDGRDVLQALRYRTDHNAIVVMFTRKCSPEFVSEFYRIKVSAVVQKPDDPGAYQDAVRLIAYYWIYVNEPPPDPSWSKRAMAHPG